MRPLGFRACWGHVHPVPTLPGQVNCHPCFNHDKDCGGCSYRPEVGGHEEFDGDAPPRKQGKRGPGGPERALPISAMLASAQSRRLPPRGSAYANTLSQFVQTIFLLLYIVLRKLHLETWAGGPPASAPVRSTALLWRVEGRLEPHWRIPDLLLFPFRALPLRTPISKSWGPFTHAPRCRARRSQTQGAFHWPRDLRSDSNNKQNPRCQPGGWHS